MATKGKIQIEIKAEDNASAQMGKIGKSTQDMSAAFKKAGVAITAMGVVMAATLAMCVKAAAEEEAGITRLSVAMKNMGLSYDDTRESLEEWINTQQQKTSIADDEQRSSLASLIRVTGDMAKAQDLLTLAMDISVGMNEDLEASTSKLMYALSGNWGMIERYIPALKEAKTEEEKWLMLRQLFVGQAEEYGKTLEGQFKLLKNNIGDLKEAIGGALIPILKDLNEKIMPIIEGIKEWIAENPKWADAIVKVGLVLTGLTMVGGPLLLLIGFIPQIIAGFKVLVAFMNTTLIPAIIRVMSAFIAMLASMGPAGWAMIAGGVAAAAAGIYSLRRIMDENAKDAALLARSEELGLTPTPAQKGGIFKKPTLALLGEAGPEAVIPLGRGASGITHFEQHLHIGNFMGDEASMRALVRKQKELMAQEMRRTSFAGINRLEYFPGSSAP